jgi:hypothetical protein
MNFESASQQVCTLFHAADAQALFSPKLPHIESDAFVAHGHHQFVTGSTQAYLRLGCAAVTL